MCYLLLLCRTSSLVILLLSPLMIESKDNNGEDVGDSDEPVSDDEKTSTTGVLVLRAALKVRRVDITDVKAE